MRRTRLIGAMVALLVLGTTTAVPVHAAPIAGTVDTWFIVVDRDNGLILFVNTSRERFCGGTYTGVVPLATRSITLQDGTVIFRHEGVVPIELWTFDDGVLDANGVPHGQGPCEDSDEEGRLHAVGSVTYLMHDNDHEYALQRNNSFQDAGAGTVRLATDGSLWRYTFRLQYVVVPSGDEILRNRDFRVQPLRG